MRIKTVLFTLYSYLFEFFEGFQRVQEWFVHRPEASDEALLLLPDPPEAAVQPLSDGELGHLLLNHVLKLFAGKELF